jgi:hypothetical protein
MRKSNGEGVELGLRETAKVDEMHDFQVPSDSGGDCQRRRRRP